ncbi:uro-adherence factor A isoform X10 [Cebidichthys violaceus]|uniref:uro-adherence factor A isoform X10 n=1 Tax=Cebidichthys violaceus TaxID=271503 RepID=UPI0035C9E972
MGTQGTGRKRSTKKERSTAEDDALNLIAREAEARLAAKRAARAEAREIRMKELERQQKEIFQVQKKYYGLDTKSDDRADTKWGDIEQWMEDSERYSRSSRIQTLSDDDERMSVGSRGSVRSDLDAVGAYGGGDSNKKSKKKKKHKHKDKDRNGCDDDYSVVSGRSSRLSDESRASRSSRLDLTSSRLSDDTRGSRASRLDLQPASYASSDLYSFNGLSSSRNPGSAFNGYQFCRSLSQISQQLYRRSSLYEDGLSGGSQRAPSSSSRPLEYTSYRSSGSRVSSRAGSARASPVEHGGSVASFLRSAAGSGGLHRDLDDVTIPDFSDVSRFAAAAGRVCDVEDRDYLEKGSRAASALTAATLTSVGGTSSRRGSGETALTIDAETSIREIKDALVEVEEKYRKAMVSNAQLDNEKNNLMYQVDTLKDSLMELEELLSESRRGYEEKVKEHEREKHAHTVLQFQFTEMKETLKQSEELLNKHGIVLGPDLNINGEIGEAEVDGSPSAEPATQPAQDSQTAPTEGNSMLGNTEETPLRSSGEEEVDPEQHREMFEEEKENHASCDALCNVDGVFTLETSSEEQPTEEQTLCLDEDKKMATEEHNVEDGVLSKDLNVDIIDQSITEAKDIIICSPELQAIVTSSEENVPETQAPKGGDLGETSNPDLGETSNPDLGETETKSSSVDTQSNDIRESCNNQENKQEDEESNLQNTESCHQQKVAHGVMTESLPDESDPAVSNPEPQQEPENAEEAENDEAEEISGKSQPQGAAAAAGKKKKRKRKGKKKGGTHDDKNQQRDGTDQEKGKKEIKESATRNKGPTAEPELDSSATETLKKSRVDQEEGVETFSTNETLKGSAVELVTEEHDNKEKLETENVEEAEPVATPKEERLDHVTDEQNKRLSSETETVKAVEAVAPADTLPHVETLNSRTNARKDEQDEEHTLETEKVEEVGSITSPVPETNPSTSDLIDNSKGAESIDGLDREGSSSIDNSKSETDISATDNVIHKESEIVDSVEDEVGSIDEMQSECTTSNPESSKENTEESHVPSNGDIAADESESTSNPESKDSASVSKFFIDVFTNALKSLSGSEPSAAVDSGSGDASIEVSGGGPEEATETVRDDEVPGAETEQEAFPPDGEDSELKSDRTEKEELNGDLRDAEDLVESDRSHDENTTDAFDSVKSLVETVGVAQAEQLGNVQSQDPTDESNAEVSSETEKINTIDMLITPDSPKEATGIGSSTEQDHRAEESAVEEDPEHKDSQKDPNDPNETEQLHEPGKDKSEDDGSSQPTLQDSDEEDGEEDEGHSFDFNDMDVEEAIATSLLENPSQEEVEEGVEVMPDERNNISSSNESRPDEPVESAVDGGNQVESLDTAPPDNLNSGEDASPEEGERVENVLETQKNIPEEEVGVSDEPGHIAEEGELLSVGEVRAVAEDIVQAASVLVEEGLDAIKLELQGGDSPKRAEQVASSKDPQQTGKDVKKNSKKGKGKGKEECKMS